MALRPLHIIYSPIFRSLDFKTTLFYESDLNSLALPRGHFISKAANEPYFRTCSKSQILFLTRALESFDKFCYSVLSDPEFCAALGLVSNINYDCFNLVGQRGFKVLQGFTYALIADRCCWAAGMFLDSDDPQGLMRWQHRDISLSPDQPLPSYDRSIQILKKLGEYDRLAGGLDIEYPRSVLPEIHHSVGLDSNLRQMKFDAQKYYMNLTANMYAFLTAMNWMLDLFVGDTWTYIYNRILEESIPLPPTWRKKIEGACKGGFSELRPFYRLFLFTPLELLEDDWLISDAKMTAVDLLKAASVPPPIVPDKVRNAEKALFQILFKLPDTSWPQWSENNSHVHICITSDDSLGGIGVQGLFRSLSPQDSLQDESEDTAICQVQRVVWVSNLVELREIELPLIPLPRIFQPSHQEKRKRNNDNEEEPGLRKKRKYVRRTHESMKKGEVEYVDATSFDPVYGDLPPESYTPVDDRRRSLSPRPDPSPSPSPHPKTEPPLSPHPDTEPLLSPRPDTELPHSLRPDTQPPPSPHADTEPPHSFTHVDDRRRSLSPRPDPNSSPSPRPDTEPPLSPHPDTEPPLSPRPNTEPPPSPHAETEPPLSPRADTEPPLSPRPETPDTEPSSTDLNSKNDTPNNGLLMPTGPHPSKALQTETDRDDSSRALVIYKTAEARRGKFVRWEGHATKNAHHLPKFGTTVLSNLYRTRNIKIWTYVSSQEGGIAPFLRTVSIDWPKHSYSFKTLKDMLDSAGLCDPILPPPKEVSWFCSMTTNEFEALSTNERRNLLATKNVHLIPDQSFDAPERSSFEVLKGLGIDLYKVRTIQENQTQSHRSQSSQSYRRGTLLEVLNKTGVQGQDINVLDIPLPGASVSPPKEFGESMANVEMCEQDAPTPVPFSSLKWALFSRAPALTGRHFDAGKFHTWVEVLKGIKVWLIQKPRPEVEQVDLRGDDFPDTNYHGVVLLKGHKLWMLANSNHKVVTLSEAILLGGHGYGFDALERCLMAGLREHLWGDTSTNTEHFLSEGMMYRLGLVVWTHLQPPQPEHARFISENTPTRTRISDRDLAALAYMLLHPERLEPKICYDDWSTVYPSIGEDLNKLRQAAKDLAWELIGYRDAVPSLVAKWETFQMLGEVQCIE